MNRVLLPVILAAGLAVPPAALAGQAAVTPLKDAGVKMDPDRIVCSRERVTGSRKLRMVCMTIAQREAIRDAARRELDEGRRTLGPLTPTPGAGKQN
jgi:hypothetical protein